MAYGYVRNAVDKPDSSLKQRSLSALDHYQHLPLVLVVTEKSQAARHFCTALASDSERCRIQAETSWETAFVVHECVAEFRNRRCLLRFVSTNGSISALEFADPKLSNRGNVALDTDLDETPELFLDSRACKLWSTIDRLQTASDSHSDECRSGEDRRKLYKYQRLKFWAEHAQELVLALDYDLEGEGIAFDVMDLLEQQMRIDVNSVDARGQLTCSHVWRVKLSTLEHADIRRAMSDEALEKPNFWKNEAVLLKHEMDLRLGCALTRLQTRVLKDKEHADGGSELSEALLEMDWISFGPCISVILKFIVNPAWGSEDAQERWHCSIRLANGASFTYWAESAGDAQRVCDAIQTNGNRLSIAAKACTRRLYQAPPLRSTILMEKCCEQLGMTPERAMSIAENQLYLRGRTSYPRTDGRHYPSGLPLDKIQADVSRWLRCIRETRAVQDADLQARFEQLERAIPKMDTQKCKQEEEASEASAHPPIYPIAKERNGALPADVDSQRVMELVTRQFIASLLPPCRIKRQKIEFAAGEERFTIAVEKVLDEGCAHLVGEAELRLENAGVDANALMQGSAVLSCEAVRVEAKREATVADVVRFMDRRNVGTPGTIAKHISNLYKLSRQLAIVETKSEDGSCRKLRPTRLGRLLIKAYAKMENNLVSPSDRADFEAEIARVTRGESRQKFLSNRLCQAVRVVRLFREQTEQLVRTANDANARARKTASVSDWQCAHLGCVSGQPCDWIVRACDGCRQSGGRGTVAAWIGRDVVRLGCDLCHSTKPSINSLQFKMRVSPATNRQIVGDVQLQPKTHTCRHCNARLFAVVLVEAVSVGNKILNANCQSNVCLYGCGNYGLLRDALFEPYQVDKEEST